MIRSVTTEFKLERSLEFLVSASCYSQGNLQVALNSVSRRNRRGIGCLYEAANSSTRDRPRNKAFVDGGIAVCLFHRAGE